MKFIPLENLPKLFSALTNLKMSWQCHFFNFRMKRSTALFRCEVMNAVKNGKSIVIAVDRSPKGDSVLRAIADGDFLKSVRLRFGIKPLNGNPVEYFIYCPDAETLHRVVDGNPTNISEYGIGTHGFTNFLYMLIYEKIK